MLAIEAVFRKNAVFVAFTTSRSTYTFVLFRIRLRTLVCKFREGTLKGEMLVFIT